MQSQTSTQHSLHRHKLIACLWAFLPFGMIGSHRFYVFGSKDWGAWAHLLSLPVSVLLAIAHPQQAIEISYSPFILSLLITLITSIYWGLMSVEKWDAQFNPQSHQQSASHWLPILNVVLSLGGMLILAIYLIARTTDLMLTGGAYG